MINEELSSKATAEDRILLKAVHPVGSAILTYAGSQWRLKKLPFIGTVISDPAFIREVFMDKKRFSKAGKGASTSYWNPIIGEYGLLNMEGEEHLKLKRTVAKLFSKDQVDQISKQVAAPFLKELSVKLEAGESVDMVEVAGKISYLTMWHLVGLSEEKLTKIDFMLAVKTLRSVTAGVSPTKKKFSTKEIEVAKGKLLFLEELVREAYNNENHESLPLLLKKEGYDVEVAISLVKSLFITGTETVISFLPRMTALFLKTRYIDYLSENPTHLQKGIEEALRVTVPTPVAARSVIQDTEFHGVPLKKGQRVILSTIGASQRFGDFDPFTDVDKDIKGLWFGAGVHLCIGTGIAMQQATLIGNMLLEANANKNLEVISQASDDKGHTGCYKELVVSCITS